MDPVTLITHLIFLLLPLNLNPQILLERTFAQQIYEARTSLHKSNNLPTQAKPSKKYTIVLVGDSMTAMLGEEELEKNLKNYYPDKEIRVSNYGVGSTTIETVPEHLTQGVIKGDVTLHPILARDPDLIIIESSANNPINLPLEAGLEKQTETLDKILSIIKSSRPQTAVIFATTIAPSKTNHDDNWVQSRTVYLENHVDYARSHNIPIINIFEESKEGGKIKTDYVDKNDFIHPSKSGVKFINQKIADFLFYRRILPL